MAQLGVTATVSELNKMDGITATTTELNYTDGVTNNIQTQLNGKLTGILTKLFLFCPVNFTNCYVTWVAIGF